MKKRLKLILAITLLAMLTASNKIYAASSSSEYTIENYNINMIVNEDNTFDITERITANFNVRKHGIFRKIPTRNNIIRNDGTRSSNMAKISNIFVNENYTISKEMGYEVIKIGSSDKTYTGKQSYIINYTYNIGKDPLKNADELYYNLVGDEWDTSINNVKFKITMPKAFDESLLGFSSGNTGSTDSSNISYSVDGNVISGNLENILYPGQALTVRLTLPEGYFVGESSNIDIYSIVVIIICIIFVLIVAGLWVKYGKDDEVVETVEFYPPEGYNSAEIGFLYKGTADTESIVSLLIYLANKGYLKIEETEEQGGLFNKSKGFRIKKIKEYDGDNKCEKMFFDGLFKGSKGTSYYDIDKAREIMKEAKVLGEKISFKEAMSMSMTSIIAPEKKSVTAKDLYDEFYKTLNKIEEELNSEENKNKVFESSASRKLKCIKPMIIAIFILITAKPVIDYMGIPILWLPFILIFPGIGFTVLFGSLIGVVKIPKLFGIIWGGMFGGLPWVYMVLPALMQNKMYLIMHIIGLICIVALLIFAKIMPKRTPYGNEVLGKLKGFKWFLEIAEKPQLESLVEKNPEYFYDILPYTYALGVSDKWISQFETIALKSPDWYGSTGLFDIDSFGTFMTSTMTSASRAMTSSPSSSSSGGGSSGGGSSGGGSGGGGGGSW